jgi:hypothetical protein
MKITSILFPVFLLMGLFHCQETFAQDDKLPDLDSGIKENRSEAPAEILPEADLRSMKPAALAKDSVQIKPASKRTDARGRTQEENSVLSFNFLYYLLERYKLSDIVD